MSTFQEKLDALTTKRRPSASTQVKKQSNADPYRLKTDTHTDIRLTGPTATELAHRGLTSSSLRRAQKFIIQRLTPGLSKSGFSFVTEGFEPIFVEDWCALDKDQSKANWRYGSMLLLVEGGKNDPTRGMRNMKGETKWLSGRLLKQIDMPWGLPTTLPYDEGGVSLKIAYPKMDISKTLGGGRAFEQGEPLLILTRPREDPDCILPVIDFEGYRGEIYQGNLHYGIDSQPWDFLVNEEWWNQTVQKFDEEAIDWAQKGFTQRMMTTKDPVWTPSPVIPRPVHQLEDSDSADTMAEDTTVKGKTTKKRFKSDTKVKKELDCDSEEVAGISKNDNKVSLAGRGRKRSREGDHKHTKRLKLSLDQGDGIL